MNKVSRRLLSRLSVALSAIAVGVYLLSGSVKQSVPVVTDDIKYEHRQILLLDHDNMLVPFTVAIRADWTLLEQAKYLIGLMKREKVLVDGFQGLFDPDLSVNQAVIRGDTMDLDFNSSFLNYDKDLEVKILEALVFMATQFPDVNKLNVLVDHFALKYMPKKNTVMDQPLDKRLGINNFMNRAKSLTNSTGIVIYYVKTIDGKRYLVPQTKRIDYQNVTLPVLLEEIVSSVLVSSLLDQPLHDERVAFIKPPLVEGNRLTIYLDPMILMEERTIDDLFIQLLLLSIKANTDIREVKIMVGEETIGLGGMNDDVINVDSILYNYLSIKPD